MIDFQLLVGAGCAVVIHNFRGSGGYGKDFEAKILGRWGEQGSIDHHAAVDEAIRVGVADPDRLGVCGLSHGGFATCWLLGTSDRFKAGVAENPVNSFTSSFGVMDTAWWLRGEFGGTPDEVAEAYRERSPLTYAGNCRTPLLFVVGESDWRCHAIESEQYYRVLKLNGVPSEMLRLPDSSHTGSLTGPVPARIAQNEALVDWFQRYL
jgi:dipeptidyl aminopeptidase/acylaminoacyl peptidase